ncbi:MAG: phosphoribosylanthranilate isomerase [Rhodobacteraceae bacterium]|nr:phosphoribosylanthranilate isomerase [Paracoccaceae bacterium]
MTDRLVIDRGHSATCGVRVKICGLTRMSDTDAALNAGASYIGLVRFPRSPRHISIALARNLVARAEGRAVRTVLVVDPTDSEICTLQRNIPFDLLQLHGSESPERIATIRNMAPWQIMKAVGLAGKADLAKLAEYEAVADQILVDARPKDDVALPGGNGLTFDWTLLENAVFTKPWMLAGGLNAGNVATAIRLTGASQVDVSSGIEAAPGLKDPAKIAEFVAAARYKASADES